MVMMQKVAWKAKKTRCGIVALARLEADVLERVIEAADQVAGSVEGQRSSRSRPR